MLFWRKGLHKSLARLAEGPQLGVARQAEDVAGKYGKDLPKMRVFIGKSSGWRWRERDREIFYKRRFRDRKSSNLPLSPACFFSWSIRIQSVECSMRFIPSGTYTYIYICVCVLLCAYVITHTYIYNMMQPNGTTFEECGQNMEHWYYIYSTPLPSSTFFAVYATGRGRPVLALRRPWPLAGLCAVPYLSPGATGLGGNCH